VLDRRVRCADLLWPPPPGATLFDIGLGTSPRPERVSLKSDDTQIVPIDGARNNSHPGISTDGDRVAWVTSASEVIVGLRNPRGRNQIYVRDRENGTTTLVSVQGVGPNAGQVGDKASNFPCIADGHRILFSSAAELLAPDANGFPDIFEYDDDTGAMTLLTRRVDNSVQADNESQGPDASEDGRFVVFTSRATNLVSYQLGLQQQGGGHPYMTCSSSSTAQPSSTRFDVFLLDRGSGFDTSLPVEQWNDGPSITWLSVGRDAQGGCADVIGGGSEDPEISSNGCRVVFQSKAQNLIHGLNPSTWQIYVWDRTTLEVDLVSRAPFDPMNPLVPGDGNSVGPAISDDGRWVVFRSNATNLLSAVENEPDDDIFVVDLNTQPYAATRLNLTVNEAMGPEQYLEGGFRNPDVSPNGRWITIPTSIPEYRDFSPLLTNDNTMDVLLHDRDGNGDLAWGDPLVEYLHLEDPAIMGPTAPYGDGWTVPFVRFTRVIDLGGGLEEQLAVCATAADNLDQAQSPADDNGSDPNCSGDNCGDDIYSRVLWRQ